MEAAGFLSLLGALLVLSYAADLVFARTRVPSVVLLMGFGVLLGPLLGWLPGAEFARAAPYFGAVALVTILFEGGIGLDLEESIRGLAAGSLLAVASFAATAGTITLLCRIVLELPWPSAAALGCLLGVPSSAIVLPIAAQLGFRDDLRTRVVLDAAIADVLGILGVGVAIEAMKGESVPRLVLRSTVVGFAVGSLVAVGVGLLWSRFLRRSSGGEVRLAGALTFGVVLMLDGIVSALGGASAVAIVAFGVVLANEPVLVARVFRRPLSKDDEAAFRQMRRAIHRFMTQATFLVRTFFFVFLGIVVNWSGLTPRAAVTSLAFVALALLGRRAALVVVNRAGLLPLTAEEDRLVTALVPRGLVTAVLAHEAATSGLAGAAEFPLYAFLLVVATNLLMVVGLQTARRPPALEAALREPGAS